MMVIKRWMVAAIVVGAACAGPGQSTGHHKKPKVVVVQPDQGAPPDQAVEPDASAPLAQTTNYDPPPPPPREPDPDPPPPPPPVAVAPVALPDPKPEPRPEPKPAPPTRPMTHQEQQMENDSTRLLTLVRELKEEVAKAGIDTLSLSALRKADEIQRLSKDLKDRLRLQAVANKTQ